MTPTLACQGRQRRAASKRVALLDMPVCADGPSAEAEPVEDEDDDELDEQGMPKKLKSLDGTQPAVAHPTVAQPASSSSPSQQ